MQLKYQRVHEHVVSRHHLKMRSQNCEKLLLVCLVRPFLRLSVRMKQLVSH